MSNKKVVVIIGISSDIGLTLANLLKDLNYEVVGSFFHNEVKYDNTFFCDITNEESVKNFFKNVKENFGYIDYLVNLATYSKDNDFLDKTGDDFLEVVKVNLLGVFLTCKYAFSLIKKNGTTLNMASLDGIDTFSSYGMDYAASKSGVINLTQNFAQRCSDIRFLCLAPAWIDTKSTLEIEKHYLISEMEKHGQKKLLSKKEVAEKIVECLENDKYTSGNIIEMRG